MRRGSSVADPRVAIRHANFDGLAEWEETTGGLDGVLFDLGVSSPQLDDPARGFSFQADGPLDMRMDPTRGASAADWLAGAGEVEIADVLWQLGEERMSRRIARAIVAARAAAQCAADDDPPARRARRAGRSATASATSIRRRARSRRCASIVNDELGRSQRGLEAATRGSSPAGGWRSSASIRSKTALVKQFIRGPEDPPRVRRRLPPPERVLSAARRGRQGDLRRRSRNRREPACAQRRAAHRREARRRGRRMSLRVVFAMLILLGARHRERDRRRLFDPAKPRALRRADPARQRARRSQLRIRSARARAGHLGREQPHRTDRARPPRHGFAESAPKPWWSVDEARQARQHSRAALRGCDGARAVVERAGRARGRSAGRAQGLLSGAGRPALSARHADSGFARHHLRSQRRAARGVDAGRIDLGESVRRARAAPIVCRSWPRRWVWTTTSSSRSSCSARTRSSSI